MDGGTQGRDRQAGWSGGTDGTDGVDGTDGEPGVEPGDPEPRLSACGCSARPAAGGVWLLGLSGLALLRRRRPESDETRG